MAAGIEGGSWNRIEDEWSLNRAEAMHSYWQRNGPPLNIAAHVIGQSLGIDWKKKPAIPDFDQEAPAGQTIAELAATGMASL